MENYSLVNKLTNQIVQFVSSSEDRFQVHEDFEWVVGPDKIIDGKQTADYTYSNGTIALKKQDTLSYEVERRYNYPSLVDQLDQLWHDMNSGTIPGKETSEWFQSIAEVKEKYPKE
jgi:hypothetical protein